MRTAGATEFFRIMNEEIAVSDAAEGKGLGFWLRPRAVVQWSWGRHSGGASDEYTPEVGLGSWLKP